jgi:hypothetical protein
MRKTPLLIVLALASMNFAPHRGAQAQGVREEGPIAIEKCQTINQPGSYKLVNNLIFNGPSSGACLSITASFVTIDLAGFSISGIPRIPPFAAGAIVAGDENGTGVTVRNGSISGGFTAGVFLAGYGSIVEGIRITGGGLGGVGISAIGVIRGNTVVGIAGPGPGNGTGIFAAGGVITGNYSTSNRAFGILVGPGSTVAGNTVVTSLTFGGFGIVAACPSNVIDNTATGDAGQNLVPQGTGCNDTNNVAP